MAHPLTEYDEDALVADFAAGQLTQAQIAEKHGLSTVYIGQLARGERRPELQARIEAAAEGMLAQTRRLGARLASVAMGRLGTLTAKDSDAPPETQRKAAVDILKFALGDPSKAEVNVNQTQAREVDLTGLSETTKNLVAEELGYSE